MVETRTLKNSELFVPAVLNVNDALAARPTTAVASVVAEGVRMFIILGPPPKRTRTSPGRPSALIVVFGVNRFFGGVR